jgi:ribonuclease HI
MWECLGLSSIIANALAADRAGSAVLEYILCLPDNIPSGFEVVQLKELVAVTCWYLWWLRRRQTHGESIPPVFRCKLSILAITANASKASGPSLINRDGKWQKPEPRVLKLNTDASFYADSSAGSAGAIIRDYEGSFVAASCRPLSYVASAMMAEAIAMKEGLELAQNLGCNRLIAESDSTETIEACSGESRWWNESTAIYADCIDISSAIGNVSFSFCPREANQVAHEIAKFGYIHNQNCNWVDEPPSFILDRLVNDVTIL